MNDATHTNQPGVGGEPGDPTDQATVAADPTDQVTVAPAQGPLELTGPGDGPHEDGHELGDRVRPYAITGGRTRPAGDDLPIETLVRRTVLGSLALLSARLERRSILALAEQPVSVAEIASLAGVHLGVARVLVGDLAAEHLLTVYRPRLVADRPDVALLERVLHGLRAL